MTDPLNRNLGQCFIYSKSGRVPKDLKDSIDGRITVGLISDEKAWPDTDYYVQVASLSSKAERAAATMGALAIVVLPEGLRFLLDAIDARCFAGQDVYLYVPGKAGDTL